MPTRNNILICRDSCGSVGTSYRRQSTTLTRHVSAVQPGTAVCLADGIPNLASVAP
jgi:hypothetical protein